MTNLKRTKTQMLQDLVERYRMKHKATSVNLQEVAAWAVLEKEYEPEQRSTIKVLAHELAAALREAYITDPQGRRVRKKHAERAWRDVHDGKQKQLVLWHDISEATRTQMQAAFQQRRHGVFLDCQQLNRDVESYNENYNKGVPIQMCFDFREDLEDAAHASAGDD